MCYSHGAFCGQTRLAEERGSHALRRWPLTLGVLGRAQANPRSLLD